MTMTIHVDKEQEWDPFVKKVMDKFKDLEKKIDAANFNISLLISKSKSVYEVETPKIDLKDIRPGKIIQTKEKIRGGK